MTQKDLAAALFLAQQTIASYEANISSPNPETLSRIAEVFGVSASELLGEPPKPSSARGVMIPVVGVVAAGIPIAAVETVIGYEEIDARMAQSGTFFGLRIRGDSMEPRVREGDVVIVRRQATADTGDVAVVLVNGEDATVKRVKREPDGGLWLLPNNPAYAPQHFSPAEIESLPVTVVGVCVELRGAL